MTEDNIIDKINYKSYIDKKSIDQDGSAEPLQKAEGAILKEIKGEMSGGRILDIGVGTGRTIELLTRISRNYIGIDYSPNLIDFCRERYPEVDLRCCDARNLSIFENEEFDFIFFSFNGLDYASHTNRIVILQEIVRVLKKGGLFAFSSHNKGVFNFGRFGFDWPPFTLNPRGMIKYIQKIGVGLFNHLKNRRYEVYTDKYSIITDFRGGYNRHLNIRF